MSSSLKGYSSQGRTWIKEQRHRTQSCSTTKTSSGFERESVNCGNKKGLSGDNAQKLTCECVGVDIHHGTFIIHCPLTADH